MHLTLINLGEEQLELLSPRHARLALLGLGRSPGGSVMGEVSFVKFHETNYLGHGC